MRWPPNRVPVSGSSGGRTEPGGGGGIVSGPAGLGGSGSGGVMILAGGLSGVSGKNSIGRSPERPEGSKPGTTAPRVGLAVRLYAAITHIVSVNRLNMSKSDQAAAT